MATNIKVLVTGSANGKFTELFTKAKQMHEKYGPFDVHLCTGNFFSPDCTVDDLLQDKIDVPLMTYFISGETPFPTAVQQKIHAEDGQVCNNLYYLGKQGVLTTSEGLKIAFVSGLSTPEDIQKITKTSGVDFLLSHEWPEDINQLSSLPVIISEEKSSALITEAAMAVKPRYHFAASQAVFYEREPYKNIVEDRATHVTRFIGLGDVLNKEKQRWFYAFNLVPMSKASQESLETLPDNTTDCPFTSNKRKLDHGGSFFWGQDAKRTKTDIPPASYICKRCHMPGHYIKDCPTSDYVCRKCNVPGHNIRDCPENKPEDDIPPEGYVCNICKKSGHFIKHCPERSSQPRGEQPKLDSCWFCLANPKVEKHLIVSIGSEIYATLAKGPVIAENNVPGLGHILLIPITHYPTFGKIPTEAQVDVVAELEKYKSSIKRFFAQYDQEVVVFEVSRDSLRGLTHAHLQIVPVPKDKAPEVEKVTREQAQLAGIDLVDKTPTNPDVPYFKLELPNGQSLVHLIRPKERFNLQFGRLVVAHVLGSPEREDWKACGQTEEEEKANAIAFKEAFKPFDFSLDE